jgi:hypothetical protein
MSRNVGFEPTGEFSGTFRGGGPELEFFCSQPDKSHGNDDRVRRMCSAFFCRMLQTFFFAKSLC